MSMTRAMEELTSLMKNLAQQAKLPAKQDGDPYDFSKLPHEEWIDEATGYKCRAVRWRHPWCGYVEVPKTHPLFGVHYGSEDGVECLRKLCDAKRVEFNSNKDMTRIGMSAMLGMALGTGVPLSPETAISVHGGLTYSSDMGAPGTWWFGFDCAHHNDQSFPNGSGTFRDLSYVQSECARLAKQLHSLEPFPLVSFLQMLGDLK